MELNWLETFITLAESGSMRTAASTLGISPATASERISSLEDELGIRLLVRNSSGSVLTEAGSIYLDRAKALTDGWDDIISLVKPIENTTFHHLCLGFPGNCLPPIIGRFIDRFMLKHPEIELSLTTDIETGVTSGLKSHDVDIFFVFEPSSAAKRELEAKPVHHTTLGILLPSDHRLALLSSVSLSELDGETFVLYPSTSASALGEIQRKLLQSSGIRYIEYGGRFSSTQFQLTSKIGCGIVFCPKVLSRNIPPKTIFMNLNDDNTGCDIYMMYDPSNNNYAKKLFLDEFGDQEGADEV